MSAEGRRRGFVSLVGAGPGDPGLLTLAGHRAIERADVVLYDHLASPALLTAAAVTGQERIHVGKTAEPGRAKQAEINALIVKRALAGQRVVRLKGGDPLVLGRGAEEARACREAGVPFEIIPGVSSIHGVPAYAGIPVTHRDVASGFSVLTGHERADAGFDRVDWTRVAGRDGTIVVLMGVLQIARWSKGLMDGGMTPDTPVALIRWGSTPRQRTLLTTLGEAAEDVREAGLRPPAVAVVGRVVSQRSALEWFESRPLFGHTIALTRSRGGDREVFEPLTDMGARLVELPLTRQEAVADDAALREAIARGDATDVVFTSANGVRFFAEVLERCGEDARWFAGRRVWAVGPATARKMRGICGVGADEVPETASAAGLVAHAAAIGGVRERRFLFPAAEGARPTLSEGLTRLGASVEEIATYRTVALPGLAARLVTAMEDGLTMAVLASPSAVDALADAAAEADLDTGALAIAAIGPTTAGHARSRGLRVEVVPEEHTMAGLAEAVIAWAEATRDEIS